MRSEIEYTTMTIKHIGAEFYQQGKSFKNIVNKNVRLL